MLGSLPRPHGASALLLVLGAVLTWSGATPASAQRRPRPAPSAPAVDPALAELVTKLESRDTDAIQEALEGLGLHGTADVVAPIAARIRRGLPPDLLELAVDTLAVTGREEAGPVLAALTTHRRPAIRIKAVQGVAALKPRGAEQNLAAALGDADAQVRAAAAIGLGQLGARSSVDRLFLALEHNVLEASTSIGQLASPAEVTRLLGYLGRLGFDVLTPALNEILARADVPERAKLDVVARLAELATSGAKIFLQDYVATLAPGAGGAVRRAAEDAAMRIAD
jgi:HEAT repeat protein